MLYDLLEGDIQEVFARVHEAQDGAVAVLGGEAAHRGSTALQEGAERHGDDLEDPAGSRAELRKLNAPELMKDVFLKAEYEDGIRTKATEMRAAA